MDADDGQTGFFIIVMPSPQLRDDIAAVDSTVGPKLHQYDSALQIANGKRFAVDPILSSDVRGSYAMGNR